MRTPPPPRGSSARVLIALGTAAAVGITAWSLSSLLSAALEPPAPTPAPIRRIYTRFVKALRNVLAGLGVPVLVADVGGVLALAGLLDSVEPFPAVAVSIPAPSGPQREHPIEAGALLFVGTYARVCGSTPEARTQWLTRARTQATAGGSARLPVELSRDGGFIIVLEPRVGADSTSVEAEAPIVPRPDALRLERSQLLSEFEGAGYSLCAAPHELDHTWILVFKGGA